MRIDSAKKRAKSCVKRAAESDRTPFTERIEYGLFNISYCYYNQLHFENLSNFFKKSKRRHMLGPPPPVRFSSLFNDPPPILNERSFWMTPSSSSKLWLYQLYRHAYQHHFVSIFYQKPLKEVLIDPSYCGL